MYYWPKSPSTDCGSISFQTREGLGRVYSPGKTGRTKGGWWLGLCWVGYYENMYFHKIQDSNHCCAVSLCDLALMKSIGRDVEFYRGTVWKSIKVYCGPIGDVMAAV